MNELFKEENGVWLVNESNKDYHLFDIRLAEELSTFFKNSTVCDLGCGLGDYVKHFKSKGIICDGYDGNPNTVILTKGECSIIDLSQPLPTDFPIYEYVLSLEVGEHIPAQFEETFVKNLDFVNLEGIVLSWAVEGQGGMGHVNCKNNDYIIAKFEELGYTYNTEVSNKLREAARLPYFKNTIMVFNKE